MNSILCQRWIFIVAVLKFLFALAVLTFTLLFTLPTDSSVIFVPQTRCPLRKPPQMVVPSSGAGPGGAAPISWANGFATGGASAIGGWGTNPALSLASSLSGTATGFASGVGGLADIASAAAYGVGAANGYGFVGRNIVLPIASVISGWGGIMQSAAPYLGEYGLPALVMGNLMQGITSAPLAAYQRVTANITANADTILSNKVRNIETVCKMLGTQEDVAKKMLKESIDGDSKAIQNL